MALPAEAGSSSEAGGEHGVSLGGALQTPESLALDGLLRRVPLLQLSKWTLAYKALISQLKVVTFHSHEKGGPSLDANSPGEAVVHL